MGYRENPLSPQENPSNGPLVNSHEVNQLEAELKALFIQLFDENIRPMTSRVNTAGMPHLGTMDQIEQAVKVEGLALVRKEDEAPMRYAFKAWRARNPKRGLHMLRIYLQMLWPNGWTLTQMWAPNSGTYPVGLVYTDGGSHFLTSRVQIEIQGSATDGADVLKVAGALRSVIPARLVLYLTITQRAETGLSMAPVFYKGSYIQSFEGTVF